LKSGEVSAFFPDVDEIHWLAEPRKPDPGYEQPTISLSRLQPSESFENGNSGFRATVAVVPMADLVDAREWLMDVVMPEVLSWLDVQRSNAPTRGRATYARWYWPTKRKRIHTDA